MGQLAKAISLQPRINHRNLKAIRLSGLPGGNDYGINVWGKCVFAPSLTEAIKVIPNLQQEVTRGGNWKALGCRRPR